MNNTMLSKEEIIKLRKLLPHGGIKKLAEITGFEYSNVSLVMNGHHYNKEIIEAAVEMVKGRIGLNEEVQSLIKNTYENAHTSTKTSGRPCR
jgi:hypothetical protein